MHDRQTREGGRFMNFDISSFFATYAWEIRGSPVHWGFFIESGMGSDLVRSDTRIDGWDKIPFPFLCVLFST